MLWHNYIYQVSGSLNVSEHQSRSAVSESVQINPNFDCKFTDKNFSSKEHNFRRRFFLTSNVWPSVRQCWHWKRLDTYNRRHSTWASYQIRKIAGCACAGNVGIVFPHPRFQRKPWRTCHDACRDRLPAVTGKTFPAFPAHAHLQLCVSGKRPMATWMSHIVFPPSK